MRSLRIMRRRDWAGTVFIGCLVALAGLLRDNATLVVIFTGGALASAGVILFDVTRGRDARQPAPAPPLVALAEPDTQLPAVPIEPKDVGRTPEDLWAFFDGLTDLQADNIIRPFIGRPLTVTGLVSDVGARKGTFLQVVLQRQDQHAIYLMFEDPSWVDPLAAFKRGDGMWSGN